MGFDFINPWMLAGLAGVLLPVLAHLLNRKKYDTVDWGAMQFLELGRKARRRLRLEELLLLLLRMAMIALIAFALARPWASGAWFSRLSSSRSRDVVVVIDSSYSMGWEGDQETPHVRAIQFAHEFLEELNPGDTVTLLDVRDTVRAVTDGPTTDLTLVREELDRIPPPSGASNLASGITRALQALSRTSNLAREVIVYTDGQRLGWNADDDSLWERCDDLRKQPRIEPRIWVVDVAARDVQEPPANFALENIQASRELTVPFFPIRFQSKLRYFGGDAPVTRRVYFEVDGIRLPGKTLTLELQPGGEASIEFEHKLETVGSHWIRIGLDGDNLPGDNTSVVATVIAEALPVLIVDGDVRADPVQSESFFAKAAFSASGNQHPWVNATVIPATALSRTSLGDFAVVLLANVPRLAREQIDQLESFLANGGGVWLALGDQVDAQAFNADVFAQGDGWLPLPLVNIARTEADAAAHVLDGSLDLPWLIRFRTAAGGGLTGARFTAWWTVDLAARSADQASGTEQKPAPAIIAARLDTGDPFLITRRFGRGEVVMMTSPVDADWSTLPAKPDYVSFLHEVVFHLASQRAARNVDVGMPLITPLPTDQNLAELQFRGPDNALRKAEAAGTETHPLVKFSDTDLPGLYSLTERDNPEMALEHFTARSDREESDLTPLNETEYERLTANERMAFVNSTDELTARMFVDESRSEFWYPLLLIFVAFLVFEVVMTRRLVSDGHAAETESAVATTPEVYDWYDQDELVPIEQEIRRGRIRS